jgi:hypothetical protein
MENEDRRYYVYILKDPFTNEIFYVGKGTDDRIDSHEKEASGGGMSEKCQRIRSIWSKNRGIQRCKVRENLTSGEAEYIEAKVIREIGLDKLTNQKFGTEWLVSVPSVDEDGNRITLRKPLMDLSEDDLKVLIAHHEEMVNYHSEKVRLFSDFIEIESKSNKK